MSHLMNTYARLPVAFSHGQGALIFDTHGKRYLDALAGIAVSTLGHAHPRLIKILSAQLGRLIHTSNLYRVPEQEALADKLADIACMDEVFFCNSGCEANEAALKLARLYGHQRGIASPVIMVMEKAFHGRTLATLSATGNRKVQAGFEPLVGGFVRVPFNDLAAVALVAKNNTDVVAVLVEPIQGEGGVNIATTDYLQGLCQICDQYNWLLIFDEVQCGIGRTGKWFAHQHANIVPDVMTLAKGLGSGIPIGACLAKGKGAGVFKPGNHGSTFGGSPFASTAALATLQIIEDDKLIQHAQIVGDKILHELIDKLGKLPGVLSIQGKGLMIGIRLDRPCGVLVEQALERGLLINVTVDSVIRLLPPLVLSVVEAQELVSILSSLVHDFLSA